jgi:zona occludens toxin (predicted ATPase)
MQRDTNDAKRLSAPATAAMANWSKISLLLGAAALIFVAVWYFGGDRFTSTPTMGGTNGTAPASTPIPGK